MRNQNTNSKSLQWTVLATLGCLIALPGRTTTAQATHPALTDTPVYTATGELKRPERYREWIFLTAGIDMSYDTSAVSSGHSTFQNVFASPSAYRAFLQTGTWPDKTMLLLEVRPAQGASSINKRGHTQSADISSLEVHVKDARLEGGWGFYAFGKPDTAKLIQRPANCYQCHEAHAAVDTTFVQFYPTLLPLAESNHTLSPAYLKEMDTPTAK
jgi:Cytochrome P460